MMLSLSQLERARRNPAKFVAAEMRRPGSFFNSKTFYFYFVLAAQKFHRGELTERKALDFFALKCQEKLESLKGFEQKLPLYWKKLERYFELFEALGNQAIQTQKRVRFSPAPPHVLTGAIARFDIVPAGGYAATLFEMKTSDWKNQIRMPILQRALADELGCGLEEVKMGVYCVEAEEHSYTTFGEDAVLEAIAGVTHLLGELERRSQAAQRKP